jgi:hypothetical protein
MPWQQPDAPHNGRIGTSWLWESEQEQHQGKGVRPVELVEGRSDGDDDGDDDGGPGEDLTGGAPAGVAPEAWKRVEVALRELDDRLTARLDARLDSLAAQSHRLDDRHATLEKAVDSQEVLLRTDLAGLVFTESARAGRRMEEVAGLARNALGRTEDLTDSHLALEGLAANLEQAVRETTRRLGEQEEMLNLLRARMVDAREDPADDRPLGRHRMADRKANRAAERAADRLRALFGRRAASDA